MPGSLLAQLAARRLTSDPALAAYVQPAATTITTLPMACSTWSDDAGHYVNRETGKEYTPHHEAERQFVTQDAPRRMLAKGGEGGGKSVAGIIKTLERLRRGMHGAMGSPDFEHFKKSLWPEFRRWCPWGSVTERHQYRAEPDWEPSKPFTLAFTNGATLLCGGFDDPGSWEGPNLHFAHFDEARRHKTPAMLKVLDGRCRLPGPRGEPPQLFLTTTPRKHWLFEYFGPLQEDDPFADFKAKALVIDLLTADNAANLADGYVEERRQSLSETEARVLLEAAWEDIDDVDRFLASIELWHACYDATLPDLGPHEPCVLALDAGESNDTFATVLVSRDPARPERLAARYARAYVPKGKTLNFDEIEQDIRDLVERYAVQLLVYDPMLMGQMIRRLTSESNAGEPPIAAECEPFPQGAARLAADKGLLDLITQRRIVHNGNPDLQAHIDHADKRVGADGRSLRIVKRAMSLKIDLAVALSMACARADVLPMEATVYASGGARPQLVVRGR